MQDEEDVRVVAAEWVARHGEDAVWRLRELADEAQRKGDSLSAEAWSDIASVAQKFLQERG